MTKILHRLWREIYTAGLTGEQYKEVREKFLIRDRMATISISAIMGCVLGVLTIIAANPNVGIIHANTWIYLTGTLVFALMAFLAFFVGKKHLKMISPMTFIIRSGAYLFATYIGVFTGPDMLAVSFIAFLVIVPLLFYNRPIRNLAEMCLMSAIYLYFAFHLKSWDNYNMDLTNIVVYTIAGFLIATINMHARAQSVYNSELLKRQTLELEEARKAAENANHAKTDFLSNMSHEIRTPINAVLGLNEMVLRESTEENIKSYAKDIDSAGNTMLNLVNDLLDMSRIEAGKIQLIPNRYELMEPLNDVINMLRIRAAGKGLKLEIDINPKLPRIMYGDEVRVKQIITNIMTNAVKYTQKGNICFRVDFEKKDEDNILLKVSVKDTGIGMRQETIDRLFVPFERSDDIENHYIEGTGLGMPITQKFLKLMGSELQVESVYGEGSCFSFELIQKVEDWTEIGNFRAAVSKMHQNKETYHVSFTAPEAKVLMVDDSEINRKVFRGLLKMTQIQIEEAGSGRECLDMCSDRQYDIIYMDHMMPGMDGVEAFKRLRTEEGINQKTPVIIMTANAIVGASEEYLRKGFDDYLAKPVKPEILEQSLVKFLPKEKVSRL